MKKFLILILAFAGLDSGLAGDEARFCEADFWKTATPQDMDLLENPNFWCEEHGLRLIHRAVLASTDVFRAFLEKKPVLNVPDRDGRTALILAARFKASFLANIELLVGAGADLNLQSIWGHTALIWAALRGGSEIVQALISAGANLNLQNKAGDTALIWAALRGDTKVVQSLVEAGADLDLQNQWGDTALIFAAHEGHLEAVQALVKAGADLDSQNQWGETAPDLGGGKGA